MRTTMHTAGYTQGKSNTLQAPLCLPTPRCCMEDDQRSHWQERKNIRYSQGDSPETRKESWQNDFKKLPYESPPVSSNIPKFQVAASIHVSIISFTMKDLKAVPKGLVNNETTSPACHLLRSFYQDIYLFKLCFKVYF